MHYHTIFDPQPHYYFKHGFYDKLDMQLSSSCFLNVCW